MSSRYIARSFFSLPPSPNSFYRRYWNTPTIGIVYMYTVPNYYSHIYTRFFRDRVRAKGDVDDDDDDYAVRFSSYSSFTPRFSRFSATEFLIKSSLGLHKNRLPINHKWNSIYGRAYIYIYIAHTLLQMSAPICNSDSFDSRGFERIMVSRYRERELIV